MNVDTRQVLVALIALTISVAACSHRRPLKSQTAFDQLPHVFFWAWERPEDLQFLDPQRFGVAFLAQTLTLENDKVVLRPRRQPLRVNPQAKLIAVTRVESQKVTGKRAALSGEQRKQITDLVLKTLSLDRVAAVQIDFDAASTERSFYSSLLNDLRTQLPQTMPLSMTALASFCIGDRWLNDLPVDEAVPMIFRMGADDQPIKNALAAGNDFREPLCRHSYGIAVDEPFEMKFDESRRLYFFADHAWTEKDLALLPGGYGK
jgi:uncharacterized protein DUF3142